MIADANKPSLRKNLDIVSAMHDGERVYAIRDPLGFAQDPIVVRAPVLFLMSLMNGKSSITDIQAEFTRKFGELIMSEQVCGLVRELDACGLLESPAFQTKMRGIEEAYGKARVREASHSGEAYPAEKAELKSLLEGAVPVAGRKGPRTRPPPRGIVAPHIDFGRGLKIYQEAYTRLLAVKPPRTVVIFGTGHFAETGPYILTRKDFSTPLGRMRSDEEFCDALVSRAGFDLCRGELLHRTEHSIEFQVLFLQHLFGGAGGRGMPRIVPVLCTSFDAYFEEISSPMEVPEVKSFVDALTAAIASCPGPVLFVAGADMCHVGPKFGGPAPLRKGDVERVRRDDIACLAAAVAGGADGFYRAVASRRNCNQICSVVSIYTLLKCLEGESAAILGYDMAVEPDGSAAVGFAAMAIGA